MLNGLPLLPISHLAPHHPAGNVAAMTPPPLAPIDREGMG
jgi:hypothetical protein